MERKSVKSSQINSIGYDPNSRILEIEFNNGKVYQYAPVTASCHQELMSAESHGKYFNANIKNNELITTTKIE